MTSKFENSVRIVNGPSKWDLILALFESKKMEFTVEPIKYGMRNVFRIQVNAVEAEDGSRESWNITGGIIGISQWSREPNPNSVEKIAWRSCKIYFHTQCRSGILNY